MCQNGVKNEIESKSNSSISIAMLITTISTNMYFIYHSPESIPLKKGKTKKMTNAKVRGKLKSMPRIPEYVVLFFSSSFLMSFFVSMKMEIQFA